MRARHVFGEALREEQLEAGVGEHAQRRRVRVQAAARKALATQEECVNTEAARRYKVILLGPNDDPCARMECAETGCDILDMLELHLHMQGRHCQVS